MITQVLTSIFGTKNQREIKRIRKIVSHINTLEPTISSLSDEQLKAKTVEFRTQVANGSSLDDILPEAFATVREAGKRTLNMRHYDVQLIGGIVMHEGKIAEMRTGEGKTLVATLPLYLNSLSGKGAHLVTVNDYLARRDAEWMKPIYDALGLTLGIIQHDMSDEDRKAAYAADITYGTNNEFGFDYLRDNMKFSLEQYTQKELNFAIVDEADSILIDEARTPLIISGASEKSSDFYIVANKAVQGLVRGEHVDVDEKDRAVHLTEDGHDTIEKRLGIENLYAPEHTLIQHHINQALRANLLFKKDVDYVVRDNEVVIVDEFTGRILSGRRYSDGLHQALEAKEGVTIERENQTLASITLQNLFRMYNKLSGMSGTAVTDAEEFHKIYKLDVLVIPTNKPVIRDDQQDAIFLSKDDKYQAIIADIKETHERKQPVLVGTASVEASEYIGALLTRVGLPHNILNAKQHAREADIVAEAGEPGKITIATNMAGRGTDIKLAPGVREAGGLRIVGTERHESRRIDNQLRGRAGRQGDPGSSKFYLSLEDDLIRIFGGDNLKGYMVMAGMQPGERIEHPWINSAIESAQEKVEKNNFEIRKHLIEYDDVMNQQRKVVYQYRRDLLEGEENIAGIIEELIFDTVHTLKAIHIPTKSPSQKEINSFYHRVSLLADMTEEELKLAISENQNIDIITQDFIALLTKNYQEKRAQIDSETIKNAEKWTLLEVVDQNWKIHLQVIDSLKEGIGLRGYGQKNPLLEYKREAFTLFTDMMRGIKMDSVERLFRIKPEHFSTEHIEQIKRAREKELEEAQEAGSDDSSQAKPVKRTSDKVGRNEPCPCQSGKKYKQCCGKRT